ncbi:MAG TPA: c-type cytochrome [Xanthobacteraceae bacterium]|jgi:mono/diheme cytochrome c family protein
MRLLAAAFVFAAASTFSSGTHADAAKGGELARRWCAACHLVAANQERAPTVALPFATIAKRPNFDAKQLAQSMLAPHPQMPDRALSREEADDITAYIRTLR